MSERIENVIIVGSGPAGYTAALYTARANLEPLVAEGFAWGGLLQQTTDVENYPGFPEGIMGPEMMQRFRDQAERFGARLITDEADKVELATELGVPGEEELSGGGISYCATCDAAFFKDHEILVIGGGDSAMEEAIFLAKFGSKVSIVNRRAEFRASKIMLERAREMDNIEFLTPSVVDAFLEGDGPFERVARLRNVETDEIREAPLGGAFIAIGHEPQSEIVRDQVEVDDNGYVVVDGRTTRTNKPG